MLENSPTPTEATALWWETLRIVRILVAGKYDELVRLSGGVRLTAQELRDAVDEFGVPLEAPPTQEGARFVPIRVTGSDPPRWSIACDLWSSGEPCDLTLELTLCGPVDGRFAVELDNLHVL